MHIGPGCGDGAMAWVVGASRWRRCECSSFLTGHQIYVLIFQSIDWSIASTCNIFIPWFPMFKSVYVVIIAFMLFFLHLLPSVVMFVFIYDLQPSI